jgi:Glycosyl hydrolase family 99
MAFKKIGFHWSLLCVAAGALSVHAQGVTITGTIKNQDGKAISGATVSLKKANLSATTKTDGTYSLAGNAVAIFPYCNGRVRQKPWIDKANVRFCITEEVSRVHIAVFDVQGKCVSSLQNGLLHKGNYALNPFAQRPASGLYLVSVDIDGDRTLFKAPLFPFSAAGISHKVIDQSASSSLGKKADAVDTLVASAAGYVTTSQAVSAYSGAYDFTLPYDYNIYYYRLRIEYISTGDWSDVVLADSTRIIKSRIMSSAGQSTTMSVSNNQLNLSQSGASSQAGDTVRMVVDCALLPSALDTAFTLSLQKGSAGKVTLNISTVIGATVQLVKTVTQSSSSTFTVDLSSLKNTALCSAPLAPVRKMIWAYYYPWYYLSSWTSTELKDSPLYPYGSDDTVAIARQIDQAQSGGVDGFLCSWWGPDNTYDDNNLKLLCKMAQKKNFSVGILFETMNDSVPRDSAQIISWLTYFITTYRSYPAIFKINNNPLVMPWCSNLIPLSTWTYIFAQLHAKGLDATVLEDGYSTDYLTQFYGMTNYSNFAEKNLLQVEAPASKNAKYYAVLADTPVTPKLFMATVQPGYDERLLPGRTGRFQDRDSGNFYRSMLDPAVKSNPNWIVISTWNEFWENTYVEPSVLYNDLYMQITLQYSNMWKN